MDTSETYIKMCKKAHKIIYPNGENVLLSDQSTLYWDVDSKRIWLGLEMTHKYRLYGSMSTTDFREYSPIYRQDQLQEMVDTDPYALMMKLVIWFRKHNDDDSPEIKSMEQLWLAFVMKEKFGKVWNGEDWK